jgi:ABC-type sugar transport system permease subunit
LAFPTEWFYAPTIGLVNYPLNMLGQRPVDLLGSIWSALPAVAVADVWQWGLFFGVIILKLLGTLPAAQIEAALIDGPSFGRSTSSSPSRCYATSMSLLLLILTIIVFTILWRTTRRLAE